jgi:diguanylate cyclase (GGDEF)-like protein
VRGALSEKEKNVADTLFEYLRDVIYSPAKAALDVDALPDEFKQLGEGLAYLAECVLETQEFARGLAKGDLSVRIPPSSNMLAAPLKSLHASLKHLTWQAGEVANGNYNHNVDFLGEFSDSFNKMISQLTVQRDVLLEAYEEASARSQELENVAYHDPLTGVYNRAFGMTALNKLVEDGTRFALAFIDMDNLKYVNDLYGHNEGDKYIMLVVGFLREFFDDSYICRLGGDEFMVLKKDGGAEATGAEFERLRTKLIRKSEDPDIPYMTSLSYGIIDVPPGTTESVSDLLMHADEKMYAYKVAHKMQRKN